MTHSTTLPPGFTTWNAFLKHTEHKYQDGTVLKEYIEFGQMWSGDFIKARAFDEIMEFLSKVSIEDKFSLQNSYILEALEELTGINLFK